MNTPTSYPPIQGDALIIVDVQNDFLPGGALAVERGDEVIPILNRYIELFESEDLPIYATRDWHTADHCSFVPQGGIWPPHCVAGTDGASFAVDLRLPPERTVTISKADLQDKDAYSGFEGTTLEQQLRDKGVKRIYVGGLATDYCVLNTVTDAVNAGFSVVLLEDAIRAVNAKPGDGEKAEAQMQSRGVMPARYEQVASQ